MEKGKMRPYLCIQMTSIDSSLKYKKKNGVLEKRQERTNQKGKKNFF